MTDIDLLPAKPDEVVLAAQPEAAARPSRRFAATAVSVATGLAFQPILIVSGVLVARLLGVEGRGELALLLLTPIVLSSFGALGLPQTLTYLIAGRPDAARGLAHRLRPIVFVQLTVLPLAHLTLLWLVFGQSLLKDAPVAAALTLFVVPAHLALQYGLAILQGQRRYLPFNLLRLAPAALYAIGAAIALVAGWRDLVAITGIWVLAIAISGAYTMAFAIRGLPDAVAKLPVGQGEMLRFGLKGLLGYVSPVEIFRVDQAVVGLFISPAALGLYVVGAAFTNLPRFVTQSVGMVGYPVVASQTDLRNARREALRYLAIGSLLSGVIVAGLEIVATWLVPFFYGGEFAAAIPITRILLLGSLFLSVRSLAADGLRGMGRPGISSVAELVGWLLLAPCFIVLVPWYGLEGVAWSVVISSGASLLLVFGPILRMIWLYTRHADGDPH